MAPPGEHEKSAIQTRILHRLSKTRYACTSLTELTGGTANFVYRGVLVKPLEVWRPAASSLGSEYDDSEQATSVVVKHSTDYAAINRDFGLDLCRSLVEELMLDSLTHISFPSSTSIGKIPIQAPRLYLSDHSTHTLIIEDIQDTVDLKTILDSPVTNKRLTSTAAQCIGHSLGRWVGAFHQWASSPTQATLLGQVENEPMRKLKHAVTYESFLRVLEQFPHLMDGHQHVLAQVRDMAASELARSSTDSGPWQGWGVIHGDLWTGNVLIPPSVFHPNDQEIPYGPIGQRAARGMFVIDWELAQFGHHAYDLGQMVGDLVERGHFKGLDTAVTIIDGFVEGYGGLSEEMAFRTAIHAGVHLINFYNRRPPDAPIKASRESIEEAMQMGRDFIVKGWARERVWFEQTWLASLFLISVQVKGDLGSQCVPQVQRNAEEI